MTDLISTTICLLHNKQEVGWDVTTLSLSLSELIAVDLIQRWLTMIADITGGSQSCHQVQRSCFNTTCRGCVLTFVSSKAWCGSAPGATTVRGKGSMPSLSCKNEGVQEVRRIFLSVDHQSSRERFCSLVRMFLRGSWCLWIGIYVF